MLFTNRNEGYIRTNPYSEKPTKKSEQGLQKDKAAALKAAKDFWYGEECYERIRNAKSRNEVSNIMAEYRRRTL